MGTFLTTLFMSSQPKRGRSDNSAANREIVHPARPHYHVVHLQREEPKQKVSPLKQSRDAITHMVEKCRLAGQGPCQGKLSGEHYISHALLKRLGAGQTIGIQGTPWSRDTLREVGKAGLTANILCQRHNSELSGLVP
jgi:hypothetical protein